jgi:MFS family permease
MNTNLKDTAGYWSRGVDVNSKGTIFALAWFMTVAYAFLMLLPGLIGGFIDVLGLTEEQAGYVASSQLLGMLIGSIGATLLVRRMTMRVGVLSGVLLLLAMDLASGSAASASALIGLRLVAGIGTGLVAGFGSAGISATRDPDRNFGLVLFSQFLFGAVGLYALPYLLGAISVQGIFYCLAALSLIALPLLQQMPAHAAVADLGGEKAPSLLRLPVLLTLGSLLLFYVFNNAIWAFLDRIGVDAGIPLPTVGLALGVSMFGGIVGAILSVLISVRFGRFLPISAGFLLFMLFSSTLAVPFGTSTYFVATFALNATLAFLVAYLLGTCASLDSSGRVVVLANIMITLGLAIGPAMAANLLNGGYAKLIWISVVGTGASLGLILLALFHMRGQKLSLPPDACPDQVSNT